MGSGTPPVVTVTPTRTPTTASVTVNTFGGRGPTYHMNTGVMPGTQIFFAGNFLSFPNGNVMSSTLDIQPGKIRATRKLSIGGTNLGMDVGNTLLIPSAGITINGRRFGF